VPLADPGDAAPTGLLRARVAARGVLAYAAAFSGDELVSVELRERFELVVRTADTERLRIDLGAADYDVLDLDIAGDRAWIASTDGTARAIDLRSGATAVTWHLGHRATAIAASPDGRFVVTGSAAGVLCLRRLPDAALLQCVAAHRGRISAVAVAADSATLVSSGWDGLVIVWSIPALAEIARTAVEGSANDLDLSPRGAIAIATSPAPPVRSPPIAERERQAAFDQPGHLVMWQPDTTPRRCAGHLAPVTGVVWVGKNRVASSSWDRTVRLWDARTCTSLARLGGFTGPIQRLDARSGRIAVAAWPGGLEHPATVVLDLLYPRDRPSD
jgi:WD40 repeat protein